MSSEESTSEQRTSPGAASTSDEESHSQRIVNGAEEAPQQSSPSELHPTSADEDEDDEPSGRRSPSVFSECTSKPDPPSILDHSVLEAKEKEDDSLPRGSDVDEDEEQPAMFISVPSREHSIGGESVDMLYSPTSRRSSDDGDAKEHKSEDTVEILATSANMLPEMDEVPTERAVGQLEHAEALIEETPLVYDAPLAAPRSLFNDLSHLDASPQMARTLAGGRDEVVLLPRVDEHHEPIPPPALSSATRPALDHASSSFGYTMIQRPRMGSGRRKIRLRLQEDVRSQTKRSRGLLGHIRSKSSRMMFGELPSALEDFKSVDRGNITVSWFDGTSSLELQEHVRKSVVRKLRLEKNIQLADIRILDETMDPPEEIVLSPYIPDGSQFLLRFTTTDTSDGAMSPHSTYSVSTKAPESPSAAPSPHPTNIGGLNARQLAQLRKQLNGLKLPQDEARGLADATVEKKRYNRHSKKEGNDEEKEDAGEATNGEKEGDNNEEDDEGSQISRNSVVIEDIDTDDDSMMLHSEDPIEARLRQITELLLQDRKGKRRKTSRRREKRQVVFVLANYFVLFLSLIAISAEIQARAPGWLSSLESQMKNVADCAADQDALFKCVSNGDFAGLIASILLWLSRSVATRRIFLFGFETPKKLWTVVYECVVTSFCWGVSYLFIRRGMNPDTRDRFVQKYWKDAVYGSLAGFNAAFLKQVLKNLIPQEAVEDALRDRQLKILSWLPSFA